MHALIIEDDLLSALLMQYLLEGCGCTSFDVASTEQAAVDAAARRPPDLITADVLIDAGDGVSAVRRICQRRRVPVLFVTGSPDALADCPDAVVLVKPVTPSALQGAVMKIFGPVCGEEA